MGCRVRIYRGLLVGGLHLIAVLTMFGQQTKLNNIERQGPNYTYHPQSGAVANYIPVTDSLGVLRFMHLDSLMSLVDLPGDSIFNQSDSICFIDMADTTCVPADSVYIDADSSEICYVNGGDPVCFPWTQGTGNIYTIDGSLQANRNCWLSDKYLRFVQANSLNGLQILPLSSQRMTAIQVDGNAANNRGVNQAALEINNTQISGTERNAYARFLNGTNIFSIGQDQTSPQGFTFSDSTNLKNPVWKYYSPGPTGGTAGDSLVFWKRTKFRSTLLDKEGDAGSSGQLLSATGTGINWVAASTVQDGNGLFTSSNSNSTVIPSTFVAKTTNSVTWLGNTGSISHILRGATGASSASITFQNSDTGTGSDGTILNLTSSEAFQILQREDQDISIGRSALGMYVYGSQGGAISEPSVTFYGGPVVAYEGIFNSANDDVTTQVTLNKNQHIVNVVMGSTADTLFLPKVVTNYPLSGFSIESAAVGESGVGQEYTITNFHATDNLTICAYDEPSGSDDQIDNGLCITLAAGESYIVRCVRYNSGQGIWFSYN